MDDEKLKNRINQLRNDHSKSKDHPSNIDKRLSHIEDRLSGIDERMSHIEDLLAKIVTQNKSLIVLNMLLIQKVTLLSVAEPANDSPASESVAQPTKPTDSANETPALSFNKNFLKKITELSSATPKQLDEFLARHQIKIFSCANSSKLTNDYQIEPRFKMETTIDKGDYWAYLNDGRYLVVPSPFLNEYTNTVHISRAFGKVFDSTFKPGGYFNTINVELPAVFKRNDDQWFLLSQGKLLLE